MKLFGFEIGRQKAGVTINVPAARGTSYFLGPIMEAFGGAWSRGIVTESNENLLRFSPVYACVSRIAMDISTLRPMLMGPGEGETLKEIKDPRSPYRPLMIRPNPYMNWIQFLNYWIVCKLMFGNMYAIKDRDARGIVVALYPVDPRLAKPMVAADGEVYYSFSGDNLARIPMGEAMLPASEVLHDRMNCLWHPLVGVGPIYAAAASGTLGIRIQNNSATFFGNMSRPSGHLSFPGAVDPEQLKTMKAEMDQGFSAGNIGRVMVTGSGAKFEAMAMGAEQSQLAEQLKLTTEDVARCFGIPLHKIQAGTIPAYTNIASYNQQYLDDCLKVHIEPFERLMTDEVVMKDEYSVELDLSGFMRMDPKSRAETREIDMRAGTLTINEGRAQENRPPVTGGDTTYLQQQMWSIEALAKRDAQPDPFGTAKPVAPEPKTDPEEDSEDANEGDDDPEKMMQRRAWIEAAASADLRRYLGMPNQ